MDDEKQKKIDSTDFESRRTRFNIQAHLTDTSDITDSRKKLITGFLRDKIDKKSSLYSTEIPMELLLLIYSFYYTLIAHFGLRFYYWPYYKSIKYLPDDENDNNNDHCGYSVDELFIERKYSSFKEEIISYEHISMQQYDNAKVKVENHMVTETVKKMKAIIQRQSMLPYDIANGSPMSYSHILSLVLFTDFSQFCVDFKNSFCPISETETLKDVKKRNSNYFWMSKLLREVVEIFGSSGNDYPEKLSGPFYACSSEQISVTEFNVRICLPMSTSRKLEMAKSYSGSKGITLQFNNKGFQYKGLRGFECSFISKCPQESEVIFFGGQCYIKLENIIMINMQSDNDLILKKYVSVLGDLDVMLTGGYVKDKNMNDSDLMILKELFNYKLGKKTTQMGNDYMYETFSAFAERKRQIVLDLYYLSTAKNTDFIGLIMHTMPLQGLVVKVDNDVSNLFRSELLLIFNNVKTIIIKTTDFYGRNYYTLSMIGLLSLIESTSVNEVVVKAVQDRQNCRSWLSELWMKLSSSLKQKYKEKNYAIFLKMTMNQGNTEASVRISKVC